MYAHGELYPQAVAELRAALQDDPERADLQVVLAEMYWRTGQRAESVEVANKIIEKLPYCREANRILAAAYQSSGRTEEAATHHRRLATLDPYAAFIETPMTDPQTVDPGSVRVDRLEWAPGQAMPLGQPEWASSLSADLRRSRLPTRLGPVLRGRPAPLAHRRGPPPPPPTLNPLRPFLPSSGMDIPTWMREAGWSPSTGDAVEGPVGFTEDEITTLETGGPPAAEGGALAPGEIPEWLRAVAPKQPPPQETLPEAWGDELAPSAETASVAPPWLGEPEASLEPEPQAEAPWEPPVVEAEPQPVEPEVQLPEDWGAQIAEAAPIEDTDLESQALPSWLEEPSPGATDTIITWLGDRAARDTGDLAMPAWMNEGAPRKIPSAPAEEEPAVPSLSAEEPEEEVPAPEAGSPQAALPGWLAGVADAAAQQEPLPAEDLAWLRERGETAPSPEGEEWPGGPAEPEEEAPMATREAPDWLRGIVEPGAEPEAPAEPEAGPSWLAGAEIPRARTFAPAPEPDWLRGLGEPSPATPEMPQEVREAPGWLKSIQQSASRNRRPRSGSSRYRHRPADWRRCG
jgi:tetratricopeptide (TPR) repeat protein